MDMPCYAKLNWASSVTLFVVLASFLPPTSHQIEKILYLNFFILLNKQRKSIALISKNACHLDTFPRSGFSRCLPYRFVLPKNTQCCTVLHHGWQWYPSCNFRCDRRRGYQYSHKPSLRCWHGLCSSSDHASNWAVGWSWSGNFKILFSGTKTHLVFSPLSSTPTHF